MKFTQVIDFKTNRIDDFTAALDAVIASTEGHRIPHRAVLRRHRDGAHHYQLVVEFPTHDLGMENSRRPEVGEFAATLFAICEEPPIFSDLDVLREEDLR